MPFLAQPRDADRWIAASAADPALRLACARLSARLRETGAQAFGLLPADADVAVPPAAVVLGSALAERCGAPVAVIDAGAGWSAVPAAPGEVTWLSAQVALLASGRGVAGALRAARSRFAHLLVDLTGLPVQGEHLEACALVDAVVVVARARRTRVPVVARWRDELGAAFLGVLLTGA